VVGQVYNDRIARQFALAALGWGVVGMAVGLLLALELAFWPANLGPALGFGRLRPVHTHTVWFAFAGNLIFAGIYYSGQRLVRNRLPSSWLAAAHFWSWQLAAVAAAFSLPLGHNQGIAYAEAEWLVDAVLGLSWLALAVNFFWLMRRRRAERLHPALWFYAAAIIAAAVAHALANLAVPISLAKSYPLWGGAAGALVQSWHRVGVELFLTAALFGLMYAFLPRAAGCPIYSYRLAVIHFWSLLLVLGWTASAPLLNTALPDWLQAAGAAFGLCAWAPAWAGVLNGLLTLRGAWSGARTEPSLSFFAAALVCLGAAALEGSLLSTFTAASLARYSDWSIGHAHLYSLGWIGSAAAAAFYWMVPRLWGARLRSRAAAGAHFYLATVGILLYVSSMWIAGGTQGAMLRAAGEDGGLTYSFIETLNALRIPYWGRLIGGLCYTAGTVLMGWNLVATIRTGNATAEPIPLAPASPASPASPSSTVGPTGIAFAQPILVAGAVIGLVAVAGAANPIAALGLLFLAGMLAFGALAGAAAGAADRPTWHRELERRGGTLAVLAAAALLLGGVAELTPLLVAGPAPVAGESEPYSPLQLEGRDVYLAEGCQACHSQMIRPFLWEAARYGEVSSPAESLYDHPVQWGWRRTGPDLARIGGRYPNLWHYDHLIDPRAVTLGSTMPSYRHLLGEKIDFAGTAAKMGALRALGVPYRDEQIARADDDALAAARAIAVDLEQANGIALAPDSAMIALIAYLQRLGQPP